MGAFAVDLIQQEKTGYIVIMKNGSLKAEKIENAVSEKREFPEELYSVGKTISSVI